MEETEMAKIMKYCSSCEEGFAERFTFCPDCGSQLEAYAMKPLEQETVSEQVAEEMPVPEAPGFIAASDNLLELEDSPAQEPAFFETSEDVVDLSADVSAGIVEEPVVEEPAEELAVEASSEDDAAEAVEEEAEPVFVPTPASIPASGVFYQTEAVHADEPRDHFANRPVSKADEDDGGYYVTVIQETNGKQRKALLLGATALVLTTALVSWGVSLFQKDLFIASIGDDYPLSSLIDSVPMPVEDVKPEKKDDDEGGGGGGGGKENPEPASLGDLANQRPNPVRPPSPTTYRSDNTELKLDQGATEGKRQFEQKYDTHGDPEARFGGLSSGPGTGGGIGTGRGTGQGSGRGTGTGSGTGSGYGDGVGDSEGSGRGSGTGGPPPVAARGPSTDIKILSQPKPGYTDEARKNSVQGIVVLRVTFLANGQIGPVTVVRGLPNGLTEKAIAAAKGIKFEPRKDRGIPRSVSKSVQYSFTIY
ncbi:MAG: TonB family protein [Acidobacteria bacterium]|nr:TonB family protein [Acidobacteriota bacterium]